jgi:hypothetical protein
LPAEFSPWADPEWRASVTGWIHDRLREAGARSIGEMSPRIRPWSVAGRVDTDLGPVWFKANPQSALDHSDLNDYSVFVAPGGRYTFFDWGDVSIAHPFTSLLVYLRVVAHRHVPVRRGRQPPPGHGRPEPGPGARGIPGWR